MKASLSLLKIPVTADQLAALFEQMTGRKPTAEEIEAAKIILKGQHQ